MSDQLEMQFSADAEQNPDSEVIENFNSTRRIFVERKDPEIDSLFRKYKRGILLIQPDFQRRYVWDHLKAS